MNRRGFLEALVGIPLVGLLARLPKTEGGLNSAVLQKALAGISASAKLAVPRLQQLGAAVQETKNWLVEHHTLLPGGMRGRTIFVDLVSGDDANDGLTPEMAVTWEGWLPLVASGEGDIIIVLYSDEEP